MVFPNTIRVSLRPACVRTIEDRRHDVVFNGNEWYFQIPSGVSLILAGVPLRTSVVLHEWYSIVMNGISKYHFGIIDRDWHCKCTIEDVSGTE